MLFSVLHIRERKGTQQTFYCLFFLRLSDVGTNADINPPPTHVAFVFCVQFRFHDNSPASPRICALYCEKE